MPETLPTQSPTTPANDLFVYSINNNYYWFAVTIVNLPNRSHIIKAAAIKSLVLEDAFQDFYHKGYIIIENNFDALERNFIASPSSSTSNASTSNAANALGGNLSFSDINNVPNNTTGQQFTPGSINPVQSTNASDPVDGFVFQGDGRDILQINIMPCFNPQQPKDFGSEERQRLFRLSFDFAIYHTEDIEGDSPNQKYKKLYFWDMYYQLMQEQNCYFSTAYYQQNSTSQLNPTQSKALVNSTNSGRSVKTGTALKALLIDAFNTGQNGLNKYPAFFNIQNPTTSFTTDPSWDDGGSSLFFSAPAQFKVIDSVNYIVSRHVSTADKNFDQCFLRLERYPRVFTFRSLRDYFHNAYNGNETGGEYYLETVKIVGFSDVVRDKNGGIAGNNVIDPTLRLHFTPEQALYLDKYGTPNFVSFSDMSGLFSQKQVISRLVHSYNYSDKNFQIDSEKNDIGITYNTFQSNYVSPMKEGTVPNFLPGQIKQKRFNTDTLFSVVEQEKDQRLASGRNRSLFAGVFANAMITFRVPGSTHRQAGRFLGIDRDNSMDNSVFDNKVLGIYFIVEAKHVFSDGEYYNDLKCVKVYYTRELNALTI